MNKYAQELIDVDGWVMCDAHVSGSYIVRDEARRMARFKTPHIISQRSEAIDFVRRQGASGVRDTDIYAEYGKIVRDLEDSPGILCIRRPDTNERLFFNKTIPEQ